jgi:hypothetical protein
VSGSPRGTRTQPITQFSNLFFSGGVSLSKKSSLKSNNVYSKFPKSNWYYLPANTSCISLVVYGSNLLSTVGYPKITSILRYTVGIPTNLYSVLVGILISDAWLQNNKSGNSRLAFKQSLSHFKYFYFIFTKFSHYCSAPPKISKTILNNKTFYAISFSTRCYPCFTEVYKLFYKNKVKIVPNNLYDILTYESLAHWLCCDGTKLNNSIVLQTQSFTIQEVVFIINVLIVKFDIHCTIHMQRNQPILYIKSSSFSKLLPHILPYIPNSMLYKIAKGNLPEGPCPEGPVFPNDKHVSRIEILF